MKQKPASHLEHAFDGPNRKLGPWRFIHLGQNRRAASGERWHHSRKRRLPIYRKPGLWVL